MNNLTIKSSILWLISTNIFRIFASIIIAIMLPLVFRLNTYSFYKIFFLYIGYIGILNFGFIDGIYLKFVGINFENLNLYKIRGYFLYLFLLILLITVILSFFSPFFEFAYRDIYIFLLINILPIHLTGFFQLISQATSRFNEFSIRNLIQSSLSLISVLILYIFHIDNLIVSLFFVTVINFVMFFWYSFTYRSFILGKIDFSFNNFIFHKAGFVLTLSNITLVLLFSAERQFISLFYSLENFGQVSFNYSIFAIFSNLLSSFSLVLLPTLNKKNNAILKTIYPLINDIFFIFASAILVTLLFVDFIPENFFPNYNSALRYIKLLIPSFIIYSFITIVLHNFFKRHNIIFSFLIISISILILLFCAYFLLYNNNFVISSIFHTTNIFFTLYLYLLTIVLKVRYKYSLNIVFDLSFIILTFFMVSSFMEGFLAIFAFLLSLFIYSSLFKMNSFKNLFRNVFKI